MQRSVFVLEASVDRLDVGENALPVGLAAGHHVVHVQEGSDSRFLTETNSFRYYGQRSSPRLRGNLLGNAESQREVVSPVLRRQLVVIEGVRKEVVD